MRHSQSTFRGVLGLGLLAAGMTASTAYVTPAQAAGKWSLFVRRTLVPCVEQDKKIYAPLSDLLKAMGYTWKSAGASLALSTGAGGGPEINQKLVTLELEGGATVTPLAMQSGGKTWVQVKQVAEAAGGLFVVTQDAGMAQVVFPKGKVTQKDLDRAASRVAKQADEASRTSSSAPSASGSSASADKSAATSKDGASSKDDVSDEALQGINDKRKEPLKVDALDYISNPIPGSKTPSDVRGTITVRNISDLPVRNIRFTVYGADLGDNQVAEMSTQKYVLELKPDETFTQEIMWFNYNNVQVTPKAKFEFDPLPEKKPAPKKPDEGKADTKADASSDAKADGKK